MNKKRIVGVALAVGACGVLAAAGMMLTTLQTEEHGEG